MGLPLKKPPRSFNWSRMRSVTDRLWYAQITLLLHELHWLWLASGCDSRRCPQQPWHRAEGLSISPSICLADLILQGWHPPGDFNFNNVINQDWKSTLLCNSTWLLEQGSIIPHFAILQNSEYLALHPNIWWGHFASFHLPSIISNYFIVISFEFCEPPGLSQAAYTFLTIIIHVTARAVGDCIWHEMVIICLLDSSPISGMGFSLACPGMSTLF